MRNILLLVVGVIALAILRNLIREVGRAVAGAMGHSRASAGQEGTRRGASRLVRDPQTGTYVDPAHAVRATVAGRECFFESEASRDAYFKKQA